MKYLTTISVLLALVLSSCKSTNRIAEVDLVEETLLDTLMVTASRPEQKVYKPKAFNPAANRTIDLKHMDLSIEFDLKKEWVLGEATLTLSPYFYSLSAISLDAEKMDFSEITINGKTTSEYDYDGSVITVNLPRSYSKNEEIVLRIKYIAKPTLGRITGDFNASDQGLYFIDSDMTHPDKPTQIWSQGETEYNSHWFPTVDKPNERYTHDIHITVQDNFQTLSNGYLLSSEKNGDLRTDHWRMEKEHAPYLTMIAVGEFSITRDLWKDIPLLYYVEKDYEAYAQSIFNHTPEMLSYFSDLTGVSYPWDQYAQVVIRDFVAGAMENTTAVTFGEFVQKTDRELIDNHNDDIVAHEMFHHWFGDYVTCESWANLTLNEGFANYSEYLWTEHKYGKAEADNKRHNELAGYLRQATIQGAHPLIHYSYEDKENMFDAHSYNKGGLVLHMLRNKIGDEAFFAGMERYLKDNAGTSVEVDELRLAYEDVTGLDLIQFFDQWYLSSGHPELQIFYNKQDEKLRIDVEQIQSMELSLAVFNINLVFDIHLNSGQIIRKEMDMGSRALSFDTDITSSEIAWINFDPEHVLLGEWTENRNSDDYLTELLTSASHYDQREAIDNLKADTIPSQVYKDILVSDKHYIIKWIAMSRLEFNPAEDKLYVEAIDKAQNVFLKGNILELFAENPELLNDQYLLKIIETERSWAVIAPALSILSSKNAIITKRYLEQFAKENNLQMIYTISQIYAENQYQGGLQYILSKVPQLNERSLERYASYAFPFVASAKAEDLENAMNSFNELVFHSDKVYSAKKEVLKAQIETWYENLEEEQVEIIKKALER